MDVNFDTAADKTQQGSMKTKGFPLTGVVLVLSWVKSQFSWHCTYVQFLGTCTLIHIYPIYAILYLYSTTFHREIYKLTNKTNIETEKYISILLHTIIRVQTLLSCVHKIIKLNKNVLLFLLLLLLKNLSLSSSQ